MVQPIELENSFLKSFLRVEEKDIVETSNTHMLLGFVFLSDFLSPRK